MSSIEDPEPLIKVYVDMFFILPGHSFFFLLLLLQGEGLAEVRTGKSE